MTAVITNSYHHCEIDFFILQKQLLSGWDELFLGMVIWKTKSVNRMVAYWVLAGTGMLFIQVMLGGITRLTGSGLSITEWNILTGVIPPHQCRAMDSRIR